jgi:prevent-host-death family protein
MKRTISAVEARQNLGDVLSGVLYRNDEVVIERAGKPVAAVVSMRLYERLLRQRQELLDLIDKAHKANAGAGMTEDEVERMAVEAVREYRRALDMENARKHTKTAS